MRSPAMSGRQEHTLTCILRLSIADIAHALERELATADRFDLHKCLDRQNPPVFCAMQELAAPHPFPTQLIRHFLGRRSRHLGPQKLLLALAYRFRMRIAE